MVSNVDNVFSFCYYLVDKLLSATTAWDPLVEVSKKSYGKRKRVSFPLFSFYPEEAMKKPIGLLREYFSKKTDLATISEDALKKAIYMISITDHENT